MKNRIKAIWKILNGKTTMYVAEADIPKSWAELDDAALAVFARHYITACEKAFHKFSINQETEFAMTCGMHGSLALYRLLLENNATYATFTHEGVTVKGEEVGDWEINIRRLKMETPND